MDDGGARCGQAQIDTAGRPRGSAPGGADVHGGDAPSRRRGRSVGGVALGRSEPPPEVPLDDEAPEVGNPGGRRPTTRTRATHLIAVSDLTGTDAPATASGRPSPAAPAATEPRGDRRREPTGGAERREPAGSASPSAPTADEQQVGGTPRPSKETTPRPSVRRSAAEPSASIVTTSPETASKAAPSPVVRGPGRSCHVATPATIVAPSEQDAGVSRATTRVTRRASMPSSPRSGLARLDGGRARETLVRCRGRAWRRRSSRRGRAAPDAELVGTEPCGGRDHRRGRADARAVVRAEGRRGGGDAARTPRCRDRRHRAELARRLKRVLSDEQNETARRGPAGGT